MIKELALSVGTKISYNTCITAVSADTTRGRPFITLADQSILEADIVIGADGYQSLLRAFVTQVQDDAIETGHSFLT